MNKPVLIVIDMQAQFRAARDHKTMQACASLITDARKNINPIVFVEYNWSGPTLKELTSLTEDYSFVNSIKKTDDDGSREIENLFTRCRISPKELIVCGVNTDYCVFDTVQGLLSSNKYSISLAAKACNTEWPTGFQKIEAMRKCGVRII